jgi:hypothetical protein
MPKPRRRKTQETYHLTVTKRQAQVIQSACELVMRLGLGQLDHVMDHILHLPKLRTPPSPRSEAATEEWYSSTKNVRDLLDAVTFAASGFAHGASYGIGNSALPPETTIAADIRDVIRHRLAYDGLQPGEKPGWTVNFHTPMGWGSEPLVSIRKAKTRTANAKDNKDPPTKMP